MNSRTRAALAAAAVLALGAGACGRSLPTTAPQARPLSAAATARVLESTAVRDSGDGFYPLALGNEWHYGGTTTTTLRIPGRPDSVIVNRWSRWLRLERAHEARGRVIFHESVSGPVVVTESVSQDPTGLYSYWVFFEPGARARPDSLAWYGQPRLLYPLRIGRTWQFELQERTVEGIDRLRLPIGDVTAWRIRESRPWSYTRLLWYSRCGLVRLAWRTETPLRDGQGRLIGTRTEEFLEELDGLKLGDCKGCALAD